MQTIQRKKQQRQQLQQQQLPLVLVLVLLMYVDILGMAIVMTAQIIWIATLMVEIAVAPMLKHTIAQVFRKLTKKSIILRKGQNILETRCCNSITSVDNIRLRAVIKKIDFYQLQNVNALMKTIQPK